MVDIPKRPRRRRGRNLSIDLTKHPKVVIYTRFSPRPDAETCDSCDKQIAALTEYCGKRAWQAADCRTFRDDDQSGGDYYRPAVWEALAASKRGYVFLVYCWDRLGRDGYFNLMMHRELEKRGCLLYSLVEGPFSDDDNPQTKLVSSIMSVVAEFLRGVGSARTSSAMRRHVRSGRVMSKQLPIGWEYDHESPPHEESGRPTRMKPNDVETAQVARVIELRKVRGWKLIQIARFMNEHDQPVRGHAWNHQVVGRILAFAGVR